MLATRPRGGRLPSYAQVSANAPGSGFRPPRSRHQWPVLTLRRLLKLHPALKGDCFARLFSRSLEDTVVIPARESSAKSCISTLFVSCQWHQGAVL